MKDIIEFDTLKTKVLKYVLYKKRTEKEVRQKFLKEDNNLLDDVIEYLKEAGYINDKNYIKRAIEEYMALKSLSIKEISYKLLSKGIDKRLIEEFIENEYETLDNYEKNSARNIFYKKSSTMVTDDIIIFLKKKGYKEESINYGIKEE